MKSYPEKKRKQKNGQKRGCGCNDREKHTLFSRGSVGVASFVVVQAVKGGIEQRCHGGMKATNLTVGGGFRKICFLFFFLYSVLILYSILIFVSMSVFCFCLAVFCSFCFLYLYLYVVSVLLLFTVLLYLFYFVVLLFFHT